MKVLFFSVKKFEKLPIKHSNNYGFQISLKEERLTLETAFLAKGFNTICIFSTDDASKDVLKILYSLGIQYITIRATGYNNIDLEFAHEIGIKIANVPDYSPHAVAEHAVLLMLSLARKSKIAQDQIQRHDFSVDKLIGSNINNKTIGIVGTGKIGAVVAKILFGFGVKILAHDLITNEELKNNYNVKYVTLDNLCKNSDFITLHMPLNKSTAYMINDTLIKKMKKGVFIINTARGGIVNTKELIANIKRKQLGGYAMDVYEKEEDIFFIDHSQSKVKDTMLLELMSFDNVLITPHQAFATVEAINNIAEITFNNIKSWYLNQELKNEIQSDSKKKSSPSV